MSVKRIQMIESVVVQIESEVGNGCSEHLIGDILNRADIHKGCSEDKDVFYRAVLLKLVQAVFIQHSAKVVHFDILKLKMGCGYGCI